MHCWRAAPRLWVSCSRGFSRNWPTTGRPFGTTANCSRLYISFGGHVVPRSGKAAVDPKEAAMYQPSRPFLEQHVRSRLQAIANVTILDGHDVAELTSTANRTRVNGVRVTDRAAAPIGNYRPISSSTRWAALLTRRHCWKVLGMNDRSKITSSCVRLMSVKCCKCRRLAERNAGPHQPRAWPTHRDVPGPQRKRHMDIHGLRNGRPGTAPRFRWHVVLRAGVRARPRVGGSAGR